MLSRFSTLFTIFRAIKSTLYSVFYQDVEQVEENADGADEKREGTMYGIVRVLMRVRMALMMRMMMRMALMMMKAMPVARMIKAVSGQKNALCEDRESARSANSSSRIGGWPG